MLFRRSRICKRHFFSIDSFKSPTTTNTTVINKSNSTPNIQIVEIENHRAQSDFRVYSDIYFKLNQPLFGYKIDLSNVFFDFNNAKIYSRIYNNITYEYVPVFQNVNCNSASKLRNKLNKNTKLFKNYIPAIIYNHNKNEIDNYNKSICNDYNYRNSLMYNKTFKFKINITTIDLDEITPVEDETTHSIFNNNNNHHNGMDYDGTLTRSKACNNGANVIIIEPLKLEFINKKATKDKKLTLSEHKKIVRLTIFYTLAFFALAIITFFIIYLS